MKLGVDGRLLRSIRLTRSFKTYADLACGFEIGTSTVYRYIGEALDLLATRAPPSEPPASTGSSTPSWPRKSRRLPTPPTRAPAPRSRSLNGAARIDPDTGRYRKLSAFQKDVNTAHARQRGPGERVNAELKNWRILRKIRSSPNTADKLVAAVQTLMIANA